MTTRKHASRTLQTRFAWKTQRHGLVDPASPASDMITKPFCPSDVSTLGRSRRHPAQGKTAKACHKFQISEAKHVTGVCLVLSCLVFWSSKPLSQNRLHEANSLSEWKPSTWSLPVARQTAQSLPGLGQMLWGQHARKNFSQAEKFVPSMAPRRDLVMPEKTFQLLKRF